MEFPHCTCTGVWVSQPGTGGALPLLRPPPLASLLHPGCGAQGTVHECELKRAPGFAGASQDCEPTPGRAGWPRHPSPPAGRGQGDSRQVLGRDVPVRVWAVHLFLVFSAWFRTHGRCVSGSCGGQGSLRFSNFGVSAELLRAPQLSSNAAWLDMPTRFRLPWG